MEYYSTDKKYEIMSFVGKWTELEAIILAEVTQNPKNNIVCFSYIQMLALML